MGYTPPYRLTVDDFVQRVSPYVHELSAEPQQRVIHYRPCDYCSKLVDDARDRCGNCGAPRTRAALVNLPKPKPVEGTTWFGCPVLPPARVTK